MAEKNFMKFERLYIRVRVDSLPSALAIKARRVTFRQIKNQDIRFVYTLPIKNIRIPRTMNIKKLLTKFFNLISLNIILKYLSLIPS